MKRPPERKVTLLAAVILLAAACAALSQPAAPGAGALARLGATLGGS